jgi:hypothetical protein
MGRPCGVQGIRSYLECFEGMIAVAETLNLDIMLLEHQVRTRQFDVGHAEREDKQLTTDLCASFKITQMKRS